MDLTKNRVVLATLFFLSIVLLYLFTPTSSSYYPKCVVYSYTGLYCTGCGTLRSIHYLLHGDIVRAISSNMILYITASYLFLKQIKQFYRFKNIRLDFSSIEIISMLIIFALYTVARNIHVYPLTILAP